MRETCVCTLCSLYLVRCERMAQALRSSKHSRLKFTRSQAFRRPSAGSSSFRANTCLKRQFGTMFGTSSCTQHFKIQSPAFRDARASFCGHPLHNCANAFWDGHGWRVSCRRLGASMKFWRVGLGLRQQASKLVWHGQTRGRKHLTHHLRL